MGSEEVAGWCLHFRSSHQKKTGESGGSRRPQTSSWHTCRTEGNPFHSEDSSTLNTSFVERHNLTIRQGSAYLGRRTPCHAQCTESLVGQMALLTTYYNFVRPHMALQFGKTLRTQAMQAGLAKKRLSFREIFTGRATFFLFVLIVVVRRPGRLNHKSSR